MTIGEKIALLRKERNITQSQLAEYLYLVPQTVSRWEVGNGTPEISLLPKIALFFGVSIDELFGISALERVRELVCKYSVLREDHIFEEAMECLRMELRTVDSALKSGIGDAAKLEQERIELKTEEIHLLLQQSREAAARSLAVTEEMIERTGGLIYRLQRIQLRVNQGECRRILEECKEDFSQNPGRETLQLYFEALHQTGRYEELLAFMQNEAVEKILLPPDERNAALWLQCALAAAGAGDEDLTEKYAKAVMKYGSLWERFDCLTGWFRLCRRRGWTERASQAKEDLLCLLPQIEFSTYFAEKIKKDMEAW
ncbi:MAG: helix-turn-helix transcriptional regulator [Lachnospiraceae bacterium]|jgi:transcriptional regulator with XRE-family HTH domain|nr:helix-turn-helix transcriptional regulator [Lachnospiraceae bacterium]